jgi:DivIVA domain-containing protein
MQPPLDFTVVLRGYDRDQVDALVRRASDALASTDQRLRSSAREALAEPTLLVGMRGYDRGQVDHYLGRLAQALAEAPPAPA